jgi:hypothetical protein
MIVMDALRTLFKQASVGTPALERSFWRDIAERRTDKIPQLLWKNASCVDMDVRQLFRQSYQATKLASQWSRDYPVFGRLLHYVMDGESLEPYIRDWEKRAAVAGQLGVRISSPKTLQQKLADRAAAKTANVKSAFEKEGTVAVYGIDAIPSHQFRFMPVELIDRIHRDGYYVADSRDQTKLASVIINVDAQPIGLCNPVGPGLYRVYMSDGTFRECFLFERSEPDNIEVQGFWIVDRETGVAQSEEAGKIWVSGPSSDPKWMDKIPESSAKLNMSTDCDWDRHRRVCSLLITPHGVAWQSRFLENGDNTFYDESGDCPVHCTSSSMRGFRKMCGVDSHSSDYSEYKPGIPVICAKGTVLRRYKEPDSKEQFHFGTRQLWVARLMENTIPVGVSKVHRAFSEYAIDDEPPKTKSAALESLMAKHHLSLETAEMLLKEADAAFPGRFEILREKTADQMSTDNYSVFWPKKETGTDPVTGLSVEQELETEEPIEALRATKVPSEKMTWPGMPEVEDNDSVPPAPNSPDLALASQAAQSGQRDFVSSQMLLSLLREIDNDAIIPKYVNTFEKACDTLGRLYMQLLWRTDAFEERFGRTQLREFKEMLVNLFQQMGDFICYLRQRDIRPAPVLSLGATNVTDEEGMDQ